MSGLLIIGAGEYGKVVRELAEDCGYEKIAFLDDSNSEAIGCISEYERFKGDYDEFIVAIGNPNVRKHAVEMLRESFEMATIIHPMAYVSSEAVIAPGCVIEPGVVVYRAATIGEACLINAGAVINHDSTVGDFCQIGCNAVVCARVTVGAGTKVEAGGVVLSGIKKC